VSRGEISGKSVKIDDKHDAYLATATSEKEHKDVAVVILPDVIGIWKNSQLIADQFAANGYTTIVLDLFNGDPVPLNRPEGFDLQRWIKEGSDGKNPHTAEAIDPVVVAAVKYLKSKHGAKKVGAVGYCFGAKVSTPARLWLRESILTRGTVRHPALQGRH
jgi:dienelactone hydrolase